MTEERAEYKVNRPPGTIRRACFLPYGEGWEVPTPDEVRELISRLGMSGSEVATFTGTKNGRTVRKWQATGDVQNVSPISYAAWRLLCERLQRQNSGQPDPDVLQLAGSCR